MPTIEPVQVETLNLNEFQLVTLILDSALTSSRLHVARCERRLRRATEEYLNAKRDERALDRHVATARQLAFQCSRAGTLINVEA